ncbi:DUF1016 N-terminal domain-containing protein [Microbacterium sp. AZCO]|uniref:DUF1016 N-terminal domain-containing protein n=1 Tax=Microbacterium sp. AZCO TaxID=3142976 RepID=UPI0031F35387
MTENDPADYAETLDALERRVRESRFTLQRRANAELVALYWRIGRTILDLEETGEDKSGGVTRFAADLQHRFPSMRGFAPSDVQSMRVFAAEWPERSGIVQQPVGQLPWAYIVELLDTLDDQVLRDWYAGKTIEHTWSRADLVHHIATRLHERDEAAPSSFAAALSRVDSDLAREITEDPQTKDFLDMDAEALAGLRTAANADQA